MKVPGIRPVAPAFTITLPPGNARTRRIEAGTLRFLLWAAPLTVTCCTLAATRHSLWVILAAAYLVIVVSVLTVSVREGDGGERR